MREEDKEIYILLGNLEHILFGENILKYTPKQRIERAREVMKEKYKKIGWDTKKLEGGK